MSFRACLAKGPSSPFTLDSTHTDFGREGLAGAGLEHRGGCEVAKVKHLVDDGEASALFCGQQQAADQRPPDRLWVGPDITRGSHRTRQLSGFGARGMHEGHRPRRVCTRALR